MSTIYSNNIRPVSGTTDAISIDSDGTLDLKASKLKLDSSSGSDGQVLTTDGSGGVAWETASGDGKLLQVVHTTVTAESFSTSSTSDTEITGLSATITPSATSSKIRVTAMVTGGSSTGSGDPFCGFGLKRDSTQIGSSTNASGSQRNAILNQYAYGTADNLNVMYQYIDSPNTTSATEYKATVSCRDGFTFYLNRSHGNADAQYTVKTVSNIILEEIGA
tara:strand:+ start:1104 stop:1763 length:660 start_codon:yes stop_codon:yes gene_type:complete